MKNIPFIIMLISLVSGIMFIVHSVWDYSRWQISLIGMIVLCSIGLALLVIGLYLLGGYVK